MRNDVAFGQYYPSDSFVHKMDPRSKMVFLIAYIVLVIFLVKNFLGFLACAVLLALTVAFSRVPVLKVLRSIRAIIIIIVTFLINLFLHRGDADVVLVSFWVFTITDGSLTFAVFMALRLIMIVLGSSILTLTTTPVSLTDGLESLLFPLNLVKFPVHVLALILSIALRFIPTLTEEAERIISAQKARGADFESGNLFSRVKALIPILIPLFVSAFRRSEELGEAMEARCYTGGKRTKYKKLTFTWRDLVAFILVAATFVGVILLSGVGGNVL